MNLRIKEILNSFLFLGVMVFIGCGKTNSSKSNTTQAYCNPNYSANCSQNGLYANQNNCGASNVMTQYGCKPQGNCPVNYGYDQSSNQCLPAQINSSNQYNNNGYNQNYNGNNGYNGYNSGYNGYNSGYNGYNQNYNSGNYYNQNPYYY